ncbi:MULTISPECIES: hypothetical protein [unclassified Streptomyces]|uniref:hypothetical protein n=1 Tax=unclassified Streptomyces TaxID=2593676 RepID=UPI001CBCE355|nr:MULTISPECIES: hypothetical protein [unclassified Streptomyces]WPO70071.1 hypothetical protein R9806_05230 [Streptomyces sp. KN37]
MLLDLRRERGPGEKETFSMPSKGQRFQVDIDGIDVPDEVVRAIDAAIRKAVLTELATIDLHGRATDLLGEGMAVESLGGPGHTQGIRVRKAKA